MENKSEHMKPQAQIMPNNGISVGNSEVGNILHNQWSSIIIYLIIGEVLVWKFDRRSVYPSFL